MLHFDASPSGGALVYSLNDGKLILLDSNGANRRVLMQNSPSSVSWSSDGRTIAYASDGIYFYSLETNTATLVLTNRDNNQYAPRDFSPDGSKLMVSMRSGKLLQMGVYDIASRTVSIMKPSEPEGYQLCCSPSSWSVDSKYIYVAEWLAGGGVEGIRAPGLWRYNPDGAGVPLLPVTASSDGSILNKAAALRQDANGKLTYLFSPPDAGLDPPPPFSLVRSDADGVSNRVVLRPETFYVTGTSLWTPDGSALVLLQNGGTSAQFSDLILIPIYPSRPVVTLLESAAHLAEHPLRWGP